MKQALEWLKYSIGTLLLLIFLLPILIVFGTIGLFFRDKTWTIKN